MLHTSEQQSAPLEHRSPVWMQKDELSWQRPLEHSFEQHCESDVHVLPAVVHDVPSDAHLPEVQVPLQHSPAEVQACPSTTQAFAEHVPETHDSVQHSVDALQLAPAAEQCTRSDAHECVAASHMLEQQSAAAVQASPKRRQVLTPWSCVPIPPLPPPGALPTPTPTPGPPLFAPAPLPPTPVFAPLPVAPESFPDAAPSPTLASVTPRPG